MKKLVVREYDRIHSCNSQLDNFVEKVEFEKLKRFIFIKENIGEDSPLSFFDIGYHREFGEYIQIQNYVGVIELGNNFQIEILPKIAGYNSFNDTREILMNMIKAMDRFPMKIYRSANTRAYEMNIFEIFINMYLVEAMEIVKRGLISDYVHMEDNLRFFRGKFQITTHVKENFNRKDRTKMQFDEYNMDIAENRVMKRCIERLRKISRDTKNQKLAIRLLPHFDRVKETKNIEKEFKEIVISRKNKHYKSIIDWSWIILKDKSFSSVSGDNSTRALLFPMEQLFEAYVGKWIKRKFAEFGYEVTLQAKGKYLFDEPRSFRLIPDIVIKKDGKTIGIMDTKWKILSNDMSNYGISQGDMYQMFAYSKLYNCENIFLLYPKSGITDDEISYTGHDINVRICFIDLKDMEKSVHRLLNQIEIPCNNN